MKRARGRPRTARPSKDVLDKRKQRRLPRILAGELDREPFGGLFVEIMQDYFWKHDPQMMEQMTRASEAKARELILKEFVEQIRPAVEQLIEQQWAKFVDKFRD